MTKERRRNQSERNNKDLQQLGEHKKKARPAILKQDLLASQQSSEGTLSKDESAVVKVLEKTESHVVFDDQPREELVKVFSGEQSKPDEIAVKGILKSKLGSPHGTREHDEIEELIMQKDLDDTVDEQKIEESPGGAIEDMHDGPSRSQQQQHLHDALRAHHD